MKKWVNVKIVNQVGSQVKIKANKILPSAVLSSGEIFVYHRLLNGTDRKSTITLKAIDEYTDKPLIINGEKEFRIMPTTYDETQEAYIAREGNSRVENKKRFHPDFPSLLARMKASDGDRDTCTWQGYLKSKFRKLK